MPSFYRYFSRNPFVIQKPCPSFCIPKSFSDYSQARSRDHYGAQNEAYMSRSAEKWVRGLCFNELGVGG